ncbi:MAG: NifU family protein [Bacilli bacterium]|nr:NifU family protein [Bacilli bacterium]
MENINEKIVEVLEKIRPYLNQDGGDVEFVKFEDGTCYVKLTGACAGCMFADLTIQNMVEELLVSEIPDVICVENVLEA